jgi:type VI secretion system protein VasG
MKLSADPETRPEPGALIDTLRPELLKAFPAALLGRLVSVPFYPISPQMLREIIRMQLDRIVARVRQNHSAEVGYDPALIEAVAARCTEVESGARNVDRVLTHSLLPRLSVEVLSRMASGEPFARVGVGVDEAGEFRFEFA